MAEISTKPPSKFKTLLDKDSVDDGQIIMCIEGTITALYAVKKGETYEYQSGKMKDSDGTEIDITFSKNTQPATAKGQKVTIRSVKTESHGWNGIKIEDSSYEKDSKTVHKRLLKITSTAEIVYAGGSSSQPENKGKTQSGSPAAQSNDAHPTQAITDMAACLKFCEDMVENTYPSPDPKAKTDEITRVTDLNLRRSMGLFIECGKHGLIFNFQKRNAAPKLVEVKPAPEDPTKWRECQIPRGSQAGITLEKIDDDKLRELYDALQLKKSESAFANCVYQAAIDRDIAPKPPVDETPPDDDDEIPFN